MRVLFIVGFLVLELSGTAQLFRGLGFFPDDIVAAMYSDSVDNYLYVAGGFRKFNGIKTDEIAYYDGIKWHAITYNRKTDGISSITRFKGDIYFGGNGGVRKWNGIKVDSLGKGNSTNGYVADLFNFNDSLLIVAGSFTKVDDSIPALGIATWDGSRWDTMSVNVPLVGSINQFRSIAYYKNEFYFGGNFTRFDRNFGADIVRFDGKKWYDVGGGLKGDSWINDMIIWRDELYITGEFKKGSGNADDHIMSWDGVNWNSVGGGIDHQAKDLDVYHDNLIVGGVHENAGGVPALKVAKWDGKEWCGYQTDFTNNVFSLAVYRDSLVVGDGYFNVPLHEQVQILTDIHRTKNCGAVNSVPKAKESSLKLFPNPVITILTIEGVNEKQPLSYKLLNTNSQVVLSGTITSSHAQIDLGDLISGVFILEINQENKTIRIRKKIIKQ